MKTRIDDVVVPCPLPHLGLYNDAQVSLLEVFYTPMLHILYIIRVRVPLVDLVLVHLDVAIRMRLVLLNLVLFRD
jgi:hypothetical protein